MGRRHAKERHVCATREVDTWEARALRALGNALEQIQDNLGTFNSAPLIIVDPCAVASFQNLPSCGGGGL